MRIGRKLARALVNLPVTVAQRKCGAVDHFPPSGNTTRLWGATQGTLGTAALLGEDALCTTGVGCAAALVAGTTTLDYAGAGFTQMVAGQPVSTYGAQVLQGLGLSPAEANLGYAALSVGAGVGAGLLARSPAGAVESATNNAVIGSVANANFAQSSINAAGTFSAEGAAKYSQLAGVPINTVADLTAAISNGLISPSQLPVDYVVTSSGTQLILDTRTSAALSDARIPQSQWYGVNQTGVQVQGMPAGTTFDDLATAQLARNKLPPTGTSNAPTGSK